MNRERERDRHGRFVSIKDNIDDTVALCVSMLKLLPFLLVGIYLMNYLQIWGGVEHFWGLIRNIGNPQCRMVCAVPQVNDI